MNISGGGGGDTGDSALNTIDSYMGAPPIQKGGKGKSQKGNDGGNFIQGIFQALGIGNKPIIATPANAAVTPATQATGPQPSIPLATMNASASPANVVPVSGVDDPAGAAEKAGSHGDILGTIFKAIGGIF